MNHISIGQQGGGPEVGNDVPVVAKHMIGKGVSQIVTGKGGAKRGIVSMKERQQIGQRAAIGQVELQSMLADTTTEGFTETNGNVHS